MNKLYFYNSLAITILFFFKIYVLKFVRIFFPFADYVPSLSPEELKELEAEVMQLT